MAKVEAPNKDYNGSGPGGAVFENGVATVDDDNALNYYRSAGYTVSGKTYGDNVDDTPPDPRALEQARVGTALRDAAVNPEPEDFLPPTNAGEENPHGPLVVAPQIHAAEQGAKGIVPGAVPSDADAQAARETAAMAQATSGETVDPMAGVPADEVLTNTVDAADEDAGGDPPADLTDGFTDDPARHRDGDFDAADADPPAKSAVKGDWEAYAVTQGYDPDEGLTKDQLIDRYGKDA